jgi:hypothetical protein
MFALDQKVGQNAAPNAIVQDHAKQIGCHFGKRLNEGFQASNGLCI